MKLIAFAPVKNIEVPLGPVFLLPFLTNPATTLAYVLPSYVFMAYQVKTDEMYIYGLLKFSLN